MANTDKTAILAKLKSNLKDEELDLASVRESYTEDSPFVKKHKMSVDFLRGEISKLELEIAFWGLDNKSAMTPSKLANALHSILNPYCEKGLLPYVCPVSGEVYPDIVLEDISQSDNRLSLNIEGVEYRITIQKAPRKTTFAV